MPDSNAETESGQQLELGSLFSGEKGIDANFIDNLIATNSLKEYIISEGFEVDGAISEKINLLYSAYRKEIGLRLFELGTKYLAARELRVVGKVEAPVSPESALRSPSPRARGIVDECTQKLSKIAGDAGLQRKLAEFDPLAIAETKQAQDRVRFSLSFWSRLFAIMITSVLIVCVFWRFIAASVNGDINAGLSSELFLAAVWSFSLGGFGTILNLFSIYLRLVQADTLVATDSFEINSRVFLGSLFSMVFCISIIPDRVSGFFNSIISGTELPGGLGLLIPFFIGFAITLALGFLQKLIISLEIVFNLEKRG